MLTSTNELKQSGGFDRIKFTLGFILISVLAFIFLFPIYWMIKCAIQPSYYAIQIPPEFIPTKFTLLNFKKLFTKTYALRWFLNSVIVAGASTVLTVFFSSLSGYAFAKKQFVGKEVIFWILLTAMMVPKQVTMVPLYILMNSYGLYNTYHGQYLPIVAWPFGLFMMKQFMQGIPNDIIHSAKIDGANEWQIFSRVIIPMSLPAIATVGIFSFVNTWNDYMWQLVIVKDLIMSTLPVGIAKVSRTEMDIDYGLLMAGATFSAMPMLLLFVFFQKYFVKGITMGAIKG